VGFARCERNHSMRKSIITGVLALGMLSFLTLKAGLGYQEQKDQKSPQPAANEFKGKVIVVFTKGQAPGPILEKAEIRELGKRSFLVGKVADDQSRWAGSVIWLAMDEVSMIAGFDTVDDARRVTAAK
jgi:hypothetical protein